MSQPDELPEELQNAITADEAVFPSQRTAHLQLSDIGYDELHRAAFASLQIGVWKYDIIRQKMSWGTEVETILGVRPSSSPEETFFGLMHPEDRPHLMAGFQRCLHERQAFQLDVRVPGIDGSVRWMGTTGQPYFDQDGRPAYIIGTVRDITEQKLSQQWLHAQNDLLRKIAVGVSAQDVFQAIVDLLHKTLNPSMVTLLKLDGRHHFRVVAGVNVPEDYAVAIEQLGLDKDQCLCVSSVLEAKPLLSEQLLMDPRTEVFWPMIQKYGWGSCFTFPIVVAQADQNAELLCEVKPEQSSQQSVVGLFAIYRPQTGKPSDRELEKIAQAAHMANIVMARDQSRQSLQESENRFRELANAMPQLVWTHDAQGKCTYGNRLLKETIGDEALDNWLSVIHPDDQASTIDRFMLSLRSGTPYTVEHRMLVKATQAYRWFLARAIPSRDEHGQIANWYGAATDIDDLKRIEAALREERDRLSAIAATCPSVLFTYMELPDGRHTFPYAAPAIGELLGVDAAALRDNAICLGDRIELTDLKGLRDLVREATKKMSTLETTFRVRHPQKDVVWVECQASPCLLADGQICWHGTLTDITRRKMIESRLLQSEKLESIGRLAGGVAHDFNNMLTVIIGACHVLESQLVLRAQFSSPLPCPEMENIEAIRQAALRAASLTKQLLAFSRQQPTAPQQLNLNVVITQSEGILARLVGDAATLQTELADNLKPVFADPSQVEQILVNLVINARDALSGSGRILVKTRNVIKSQASAPGELPSSRSFVEIEVKDSGCGMTQETMLHIFDPFFTTKPLGKGTGLGLAVVHGIVTQNAGVIEVESEVERGTTIRILLPAIESSARLESPSRRTGPLEGGTEGVLIVDDEPAIGKMTSKTLRSLGYSVVTANSPEEAQQLFQANFSSIDILLTDLLMPGCNGVELANRLIEKKPDLRVIVMSGHRTSSFDNADVAKTGYRFLPKPYTTIELTSALRAVIDVE